MIKEHRLSGWIEQLKERNIRYTGLKKAKHICSRVVLYAVLISLTYIFLQPFIMMILYGIKQPYELQDATLIWLSRRPTLELFRQAWVVLDYPRALMNSILLSIVPTIGHVISASMVGYGFARLRIPGKNFLFMLVLFTLIVPTQAIIIPMYKEFMVFEDFLTVTLGMEFLKGNSLPLILPAFFGMGLKGALYIFIYRQSFAGMPAELENAARIDGCGVVKTYLKVMFPLARSATLVIAILSIVWRWNDYVEPQVFIANSEDFTLPMLIPSYWQQFNSVIGGSVESFNVTHVMSSALLMLLPMIIFYLIVQHWFMQGIETTGIVG